MSRVFVIAEAGVNHNGDIELAKKLIEEAYKAGADAVKFQTFKAENLVCKDAKKADYQLETTDENESQFDMLKKLELSDSMHRELVDYASKKGIKFLSTPFDIDSLHFLVELGIDIIKLSSGEITNYPLLVAVAKTGLSIILSTGMSDMCEIEAAVEVLKSSGARDITLLHCNTQYPTPYDDVNLNAMNTLRSIGGVKVGYSDHTLGIEVPVAAVALGAEVIEKHFTLDKKMDGPDHRASLDTNELQAMIIAIRNIEKSLGDGKKIPSKSEIGNRIIVRKSIVALKDIKKGDIFTIDNITTKRPGLGITPMFWDDVIGTPACRDFVKDELIEI